MDRSVQGTAFFGTPVIQTGTEDTTSGSCSMFSLLFFDQVIPRSNYISMSYLAIVWSKSQICGARERVIVYVALKISDLLSGAEKDGPWSREAEIIGFKSGKIN